MTARRTKIVATLGPASNEREGLETLVAAGADVFRLNFAHADPERHTRTARLSREVAAERGRIVGILADLPGPKMRSGPVRDDEVFLTTEERFVLTSHELEGDEHRVSTTVRGLPAMVSKGDDVFLADGEIVLFVEDVTEDEVITTVMRGGPLRSRKGMHLPRSEHHLQAFTDRDRAALELALKLKVDLVGLSFVRNADDVERARDALPKRGHRPLLVAKIETRSAVDELPFIVAAADAVMVARGDLGIQTPLTRVPLLQKEIISMCNRAGKPVITATQMLESMTHAPLPTRAEIADIANAVIDGTDALMLSEETAIGDHPALVVETMAQTAVVAETWPRGASLLAQGDMENDKVSWAVAHAAVEAAEDLGVAAILCPTNSGATPRRVASFRPSVPIVGMSPRSEILGGLALMWGVLPLQVGPMPDATEANEEVDRAVAAARSAGVVASGDLVAVVAGAPGPRAGRTDFVRVVRA
ncbi:MAG: pyruvate kinase [Actinobacteria bacterium]|nr:pyruvate kinase [Actinomycetota bacterium]